jgi:hypothetical protein
VEEYSKNVELSSIDRTYRPVMNTLMKLWVPLNGGNFCLAEGLLSSREFCSMEVVRKTRI